MTKININTNYTNISANYYWRDCMANATLTLSIPKKLKEEMKEVKGVNWSEETRQFLEKRVQKLKLLKKLDDMTKDINFTEKDALEWGRKINAGVARRHGLKATD